MQALNNLLFDLDGVLTERRALALHAVDGEGGGVADDEALVLQLDALQLVRTQNLLHLLVPRLGAVDLVDVDELLGSDAQTRAGALRDEPRAER